MNIDPICHFIVFGPTGSGKTYYTKHLERVNVGNSGNKCNECDK